METQRADNGVLILDIPVPHKGYVDLLKKHAESNIRTLYLVGADVLEELEVPKEIRANDPETTRKMLKGLDLPFDVEIIGLNGIGDLSRETIYTARDEVSRRLKERFFPNSQVTEETQFLRWDESNVISTRPAQVDEETSDPFHIGIMDRARELADFSSDWWRRVGVVIVKKRQIMVEAYNEAFPTNNKPYIDGNPRDFIKAGTLQFLSSTGHAEPSAIAKGARRGINLDEGDLYLNSFPCPPCAIYMGHAGIRRCFTAGGNAYLDAAEVLKALGIRTVFVNDGRS